MSKCRRLLVLVLLSLVMLPAADAVGQDTGATPEAAAFAEAFESYKQAARDFESLRSEYQNATPERRAEINATLGDFYTSLRLKADHMVTAALAAYKASPNSDQQVTDFLLTVVKDDIRGVGPSSQGGDQYERALEIISALIDGGLTEIEKQLAMWGIIAAFVTGELDQAEKFRNLAAEIGSFKEQPERSDEVGVDLYTRALEYSESIETERKLWAKELQIRAAEAEADDLPRVKLSTSKGDVIIELFENEAPQAVGNFVSLVKSGFYDGLTFHRVIPRFMAQGGDPQGTGGGGPGYSIRCECYSDEARMHFRGTLSMAHAGRDTGGSQFFLTFVPTRHLDNRHTAFGRVIDGIEVLADLHRTDPGEPGVRPDKILKAEVLRDRGHAYEFEKLSGR